MPYKALKAPPLYLSSRPPMDHSTSRRAPPPALGLHSTPSTPRLPSTSRTCATSLLRQHSSPPATCPTRLTPPIPGHSTITCSVPLPATDRLPLRLGHHLRLAYLTLTVTLPLLLQLLSQHLLSRPALPPSATLPIAAAPKLAIPLPVRSLVQRKLEHRLLSGLLPLALPAPALPQMPDPHLWMEPAAAPQGWRPTQVD